MQPLESLDASMGEAVLVFDELAAFLMSLWS